MSNYCTLDDVKRILPKSFTIGENTLKDRNTIQSQGRANDVTSESVRRYINFASQYIDGRLRTIYQMPLRRVKTIEQLLPEGGKSGSFRIKVIDNYPFTQGSYVRISDDDGSEVFTVKSISDDPEELNVVELNRRLPRNFSVAKNSRISILEFPDPIPLLCARYAVSMIIDKVFVGDQVPQEASFGKLQRTLASNDMDDILMGLIRLQGQELTSGRFCRMTMRDSWRLQGVETQPGRGKES